MVPVFYRGELHGILAVAGRGDPITRHLKSLIISLAQIIELALGVAMAQSELEQLAGLDPLTGLANRRALADAPPAVGSFTVIAADLDCLKAINDAEGHDAGDRALARFADLLRSCVRQDSVVARVGGDEFVIVLHDTTIQVGWLVARRIVSALRKPESGGLRASLGIASGTSDSSLEEIISRADHVMYEAKRRGGMRVVEWAEADRSPDSVDHGVPNRHGARVLSRPLTG